MLLLAVDTTRPSGSTALLRDGKLLAEINGETSLSHSEQLLPAVDFLLKKIGRNILDVDGYAVAAGPGSFTGIRVGMSTVKSFAMAADKPIAPVSTLEALALKLHHPQSRLLCPLLDAKKGEVYAALFEWRKGRLVEVVPPAAYKPDRFFSLLPSRRVISFMGSGSVLYRDKLFQYIGDKARFPRRSPFIAAEVGLLGYDMLNRGEGLNHLDVEPFYLRRSQAEENLS
ncbi:MAG: tRNA (adenosine(37)-N6)-threonylcarbamoyltransferase complex dimerization subunit type 1 TsaB [Acidobacteria bacterium]|nr:tRNA (adenosine(37)-N6)-threonylcarbamoyltransferase complex dimerization subunit type 1 TsaB [Acidobacteriota bacterium]